MTAEEAEIIGKVLDYENLAELYDPITSDPVKYTYHAETTGELLDYFRVWAIQLVKHPANAVEATMNNAYGWFYQEGYTQNYMMTSRIDGQDVRWEINQPAKLAGVRQVMERVAKLLSRVPVLNWFENAGMVSMLLILLVAVWIGAGKKRYLVAVSPLIVAVLVCIAWSDIQLSDAVYYAGDVLCTVSCRIICAEHARIVIEEYKGRHD